MRKKINNLPLPAKQELFLTILKTLFNMAILFYINIKFSPGFMWCVFPIFFMTLKLARKVMHLKAQHPTKEESFDEHMDLKEIHREEMRTGKGWKESDLV